MSSDHVQKIRDFFTAWGVSYEVACSAQRGLFAEGGEWVAGPGIPATHGGDEAAALFDGFKQGYDMDTIKVEMIKIGQAGDVIWTERIDHLHDSAGQEFLAIPVAGVMTVNDAGLVTSWTDYWDMREFEKLTPRS